MVNNFHTPWWLRGAHLQTIWPTITNRPCKVSTRRQRFELADGDFIDLDWAGDTSKPIVILLHGLCGSAKSTYIRRLLEVITARDYCGVVINFRGCSGEPNRLPRAYHSGDTADLNAVIDYLQQTFPRRPLFAIGFSLGGNVLLKYLGETANHCRLTRACAVSVPFNLEYVANHLSRGVARFYQWKLLSQLKKDTLRKFRRLPGIIALSTITNAKTFWQYDDGITAPLHGFDGAVDYYQQSSCCHYLKSIDIPTLILHARNDPVTPFAVVPTPNALSKSTYLALTEDGGHVGFCTTGKAFWLGERLLDFLQVIDCGI